MIRRLACMAALLLLCLTPLLAAAHTVSLVVRDTPLAEVYEMLSRSRESISYTSASGRSTSFSARTSREAYR